MSPFCDGSAFLTDILDEEGLSPIRAVAMMRLG
jgi:hypothetical protein